MNITTNIETEDIQFISVASILRASSSPIKAASRPDLVSGLFIFWLGGEQKLWGFPPFGLKWLMEYLIRYPPPPLLPHLCFLKCSHPSCIIFPHYFILLTSVIHIYRTPPPARTSGRLLIPLSSKHWATFAYFFEELVIITQT